MSAAEIQRQLVDWWNTGEVDRIYDLWDPDVVVRPDPEFPEGIFFGAEAAKRFWEGNREAMGPGHLVIEEEHDLGDRSLARITQPVHSRSGIESEFAWTLITTCRNGKVILVEFFIDHAQALEALCLEPS